MKKNPTQEKLLSVAVIDDDANVREGLWWLLNNIAGLRCSGAYGSVGEALSGLAGNPTDILLLDVSLRGESGIAAIAPLRQQFPTLKIIMHSNYDEQDKIRRARNAGARGYLLKNASAVTLHDAILKVQAGGGVWPPGFGNGTDNVPQKKFSRFGRILNSIIHKIK